MKKIKYLVVNGVFCVLMYLAYFKDIKNAENVVIFWSWFLFVLSLFAITDDGVKSFSKTKRSFPEWVDLTFDTIFIGVFIWFGSFFTGTAYLMHSIIGVAIWEKVNKLKKEK